MVVKPDAEGPNGWNRGSWESEEMIAVPEAVWEVTTVRGGGIVDIVVAVVVFGEMVLLGSDWFGVSKAALLLLLRDLRTFLNGLDIYFLIDLSCAGDCCVEMGKMWVDEKVSQGNSVLLVPNIEAIHKDARRILLCLRSPCNSAALWQSPELTRMMIKERPPAKSRKCENHPLYVQTNYTEAI